MSHFPKIFYLIGSALCLQRPTHSFFYQNSQLPLGSRWTGITLGFLSVSFFWFLTIRKKRTELPSRSILIVLFVFLAYFVFDGISSFFHAAYVSNFTRLFSGLFLGTVFGVFLITLVNNNLWSKNGQKKKIINRLAFSILIVVNLLFFTVFFQNFGPLVLILGFASIIGMIGLVALINFVVLTGFSKVSKKLSDSKAIIKMILFSIFLTGLEIFFLVLLRNLSENYILLK